MAEQRDNSGALFVNERRERDNQPTHTGKAMIGGREYYLDAWRKKGREGKKDFLSIAFKPVDGRRADEGEF